MVSFLLSLLVVCIVLSLICWIIGLLPLPPAMLPFRSVLYVIVAIAAVIFLLSSTGIIGGHPMFGEFH